MTTAEPLCPADLLRQLAADHPTLTVEELLVLAGMAAPGDD